MKRMDSKKNSVGAGKAVLLGHAVISLPILIVSVIAMFVGFHVGEVNGAYGGLLIAFVISWVWWSFMVPKWRRWALARGADKRLLHRYAVWSMLEWPHGWLFEKTEFRGRE
jgi:hypothetical protein